MLIALAFPLGCAGLQLRDQLAHARGTPIITVDHATFDGEYLNGRILISSSDAGYVVIDGRLADLATITVDDVFDCDGGATVHYLAADAYIRRPRPEDYQIIRPDYWYGANFSLLMYGEDFLKIPPPDCVQVLVAVNFAATAPGAERPRFIVQANLNRPDAGSGAASDAGADLPDAGSP